MKTAVCSCVALIWAAYQVSAISFTAGSSPTSTADYTITASAALVTKTYSGLTGLGVAGATAGEIDVNEWLLVDLTVPQKLSEFSLAFFYNGPEFGGSPREGANHTEWQRDLLCAGRQ
jgi:hypothetical protein